MLPAVEVYDVASGGVFYRLWRAIHVTRGTSRDWLRFSGVVVAVVYLPLVVTGVVVRITAGHWIPAIGYLSTHARSLIAIPLLLAAQPLVDVRSRGVCHYLLDSGLLSPTDEGYRRAVSRSLRIRDSAAAESLILTLAIASMFWSPTYLGARALLALATLPAVVAFRFLLLRWVWRWGLWGLFLWRVSRLPLALRPTHPDRLAGLGPVLGPAYTFATVVAACSAEIAAGWADQMIYEGHPLKTLYAPALTFGVLAIAIALAPTVTFIGPLYRQRKAGLARYGALARRYVDVFEDRYMGAEGPEALAAVNTTGLADLGRSYQVVSQMRIVPWSARVIQAALVCALVPMLPLVIIDLGVVALLGRIGKALL